MTNSDEHNKSNPLGNSPAGGLYEHPHHYIKEFDNAEDHYRDLIENASDIIYRTDLKGDFVYVNPVAARILEYSVEELLQMNYLDLITPAYREKTNEFYFHQLSNGIETTYFEFETETKSGKNIWFGQNVRIIKRDDEWIGFQAHVRDITERHIAQEKLRNNEEQLRLFVKHAPVAVAMFDMDMQYIMASNRWVNQYGIDHNDVTGLSHYELCPDVSEEWKENFSIGLSGVSQSSPEERMVDSEGNTQWMKWEIHPWKQAGGEVGGIIVYTEDITERKQDEVALVQAREEAQQASAAKSSFIDSMSHEFRTPLNAVIGFAEILKEESFSDEQLELLQQIYESGNQLLSMINDVIELSRIETSKINYEEVEFAVESLLQSLAKPYLKKLKKKGLSFKATINPDVPKYVSTDLEILSQILHQLIDNALKFTDSGKVELKLNYVQLSPDGTGRDGLLKIEVMDTGIGFSQKEEKRIFRPFTKLNDQGYHGTGLGLTVANRLCRFLGGQIEVVSEQGRGSTFTISIPVKEVSNEATNIEAINFIEQKRINDSEIVASDAADFIMALPSSKSTKIVEALELQKFDELTKLLLEIDNQSHDKVIKKLVKATEKYNFSFLKEVNEACQNE